jgi:hypothetical protein
VTRLEREKEKERKKEREREKRNGQTECKIEKKQELDSDYLHGIKEKKKIETLCKR